MGSAPVEITKNVKKFLRAVKQSKRVEMAFVYGSWVKGRADKWSDIDVAVVSPDFSEDLFEERAWLMRLAATLDDRIEPHPFRPEDFNANHPLVSEIRRSGVRVS